jgi:RNA polymerase sigma-70 factor (ECF subfamily)
MDMGIARTDRPHNTDHLMSVYVDRREHLRRFFAGRLRSSDIAEDIVQDIAIRLSQLSAKMASEVEHPEAFIHRLGSNLMLDHLKQRRRAAAREQDWTRSHLMEHNGLSITDAPAADAAVAAKQRIAQIEQIMLRLSPQCQRAFRLHKLEGLTHSDVASQMQISRSAVEKHISNALKTLLRELD